MFNSFNISYDLVQLLPAAVVEFAVSTSIGVRKMSDVFSVNRPDDVSRTSDLAHLTSHSLCGFQVRAVMHYINLIAVRVLRADPIGAVRDVHGSFLSIHPITQYTIILKIMQHQNTVQDLFFHKPF